MNLSQQEMKELRERCENKILYNDKGLLKRADEEDYENDIDFIITETLKAVGGKSDWVSVEDRLPENDLFVWAVCDGAVQEAWFEDEWYIEEFSSYGISSCRTVNVTFWKDKEQKPQPPTENKGE